MTLIGRVTISLRSTRYGWHVQFNLGFEDVVGIFPGNKEFQGFDSLWYGARLLDNGSFGR
jgi:hypothetical protein